MDSNRKVTFREEEEELFGSASSCISSDGEGDDLLSDCEDDACSNQQQAVPCRASPLLSKNERCGWRGLSKYYEGKSQTFACLADARCLDDLRKKDGPYKRKMKTSRSYAALASGRRALQDAGGLSAGSRAIAKKQPGSCCVSLVARSSSRNVICKLPPPVAVHKNICHQ